MPSKKTVSILCLILLSCLINYSDIGESPISFRNSPEWKYIQVHFSSGITQTELLSIVEVITANFDIPPPTHQQKRRFNLLILQWFHDNWAKISQVLPYITLYDDNFNQISAIRELKPKV